MLFTLMNNNNRFVAFVLISFIPLSSYASFDIEKYLSPPSSNSLACFSYAHQITEASVNDSLDISSNEFELTKNNKLILNGNVILAFDDGLLEAGNAEIDRDNNIISYETNGVIKLDDILFVSDEGIFDKENRSVSLSNGKMFLSDRGLIVSFNSLVGGIDNKLNIQDAAITSCGDSSSGWLLKAEELVVDDITKRGTAKNVSLKIFDKTILYLPAIPFSTSSERSSGFLEPVFSYSSDGLDFLSPFYKVTSEKSDITIAPRYIAKRGFGFELNGRYLHGQNSMRNFDAIFLSKDKEFSKEFNTSKKDRWAYSFKDSFQTNTFNGSIDWSKASDSMVLRDLPGDIVALGNQRSENLNQNIKIESSFGGLDISIRHQAYQSLNPILTNGYKKSPELNINYLKSNEMFNISYKLNYAKFNASAIHGFHGYQVMGNYLFRDNNPDEGTRLFSSLNLNSNYKYRNVKLSSDVGFKSISYDLQNNNKANDVLVPDLLMRISSSYFKTVNNTAKVIEPSIVFGYVGYEDQSNNPIFDSDSLSIDNQLENNYRFSGLDRIGDQKFYTLGLSYQKRVMGMRKLKLDISKKMYIQDRRVWIDPMMHGANIDSSIGMSSSIKNMNSEPIIVMGSFMPKKNTMLMMYGGLNKKNDSLLLGGLNIKTSNVRGSYGYSRRYRRMAGSFNVPLDYSEAFASFNVTSKIDFLAKIKRDHNTNTNIESVIGIAYQDCCIGLQLTFSDKELSRYNGLNNEIEYQYLNNAWNNIIDIENKSRINLSIELKGFNSSFDKMSRLFNNSLLNY